MSRAYRIRVHESLQRVVRAEDSVQTQLELLEILPCEQMAELLGQELERRGFTRDGQTLSRTQEGTTTTVDLTTGTLSVQSELAEQVSLEGERTGRGWTHSSTSPEETKEKLKEQVRKDLENQAKQKEAGLQQQATDRLEAQLGDLRRELDQAINRVTAEALKVKAAQLGAIKEMTEDVEAGSLTIVLEV